MAGVSGLTSFEMVDGEIKLISAAPRELTSFVVCELTGANGASLMLTGATGQGPYYRLRLGPGQTLSYADRVALPWGLSVTCQTGSVGITVAYQ